jgi:hypothetical protein
VTATNPRLATLADLARSRAAVEAQIRAAIRDAIDDDVEIASIARTLGVTRQTVYRWAQAPRADLAEALDAALTAMIPHVPPQTAGQLTAVIGHPDMTVKIRRLSLGAKNLPHDLATRDRDVLDLLSIATCAVDVAERIRRKSGHWPKTVVLS